MPKRTQLERTNGPFKNVRLDCTLSRWSLSLGATSIQVSVTALVARADRPAVISGKRRDSDMFRKGRVSDKGVSPRPKAARTGKRMALTGIRRAGARVGMIEVGEPRPLAADEVLLEVRGSSRGQLG
jgi:hypothetical protein